MNQRQYLPRLHRRDWLRLFLGAPALTLLAGCGTLGHSEGELSGQLSIVGATSMQPLIAAAAQRFERAHPSVHIQLRTSGSLSGLETMAQQQADIALSDTYADPILYPEVNMTDYLVCIVSFAMIVPIQHFPFQRSHGNNWSISIPRAP
jgi:ABC-type phosphate transport system substrate-binding protein